MNFSVNAPLAMGSPTMDFSNPQASYNSAYQNYIGLNQQLYNNYVNNLNTQLQGYRNLQSNVMNRLRGGNKANLQDIADKYAAMSGQQSQQMIDRGLGNTTIQQSIQRGIAQDRTKETTRSRNMYSQLMAQTQSQLGLAGLGAYGHGLDMLLTQVSAPPPDAGMYAQLAQMKAMGRLPGMLPGMPGPGVPNSPIGGAIPQGLFAPSYGAEGGGGGGGYSIFDMPSTYGQRSVVPASYGAAFQSGAGVGGNIYGGMDDYSYTPSYATSGQYSFMPSKWGNYGRSEATGYGGVQQMADYGGDYSQGQVYGGSAE